MGANTLRMLSTAAAWDVIQGADECVKTRLTSIRPQGLCISPMTRAELQFAIHGLSGSKWASQVASFLKIVQTLPWGEGAADTYAELMVTMRDRGYAEGDKDLGTIAHALASDAILVTPNPSGFLNIAPHLSVENWRTR